MVQSRRQFVYAVGLAAIALADIPEGTATSGWTSLAALVASAATIWRHRRPAAMVLIGFAAMATADVLSGLTDTLGHSTFGHVVVLGVLVYALCRHAPWRDVVVTLVVGAIVTVIGEVMSAEPSWSLRLDDVWVWAIAAAAGVAQRYRVALHASRAERIRSEERARIARDLHDVVAHHVSAISLHAEGASAVLDHDVDRAREALGAIHSAAAMTLTEMRRMVAILRDDDFAGERSPLADINELARVLNDPPHPIPVSVTIADNVGDVPAFAISAVLRIAQEAVTNARRHGREASAIEVTIGRTDEAITLVVDDDGESLPNTRRGGYGIQGMTERASLLGGTLVAAPRTDRGWRVQGTIPVGGGER